MPNNQQNMKLRHTWITSCLWYSIFAIYLRIIFLYHFFTCHRWASSLLLNTMDVITHPWPNVSLSMVLKRVMGIKPCLSCFQLATIHSVACPSTIHPDKKSIYSEWNGYHLLFTLPKCVQIYNNKSHKGDYVDEMNIGYICLKLWCRITNVMAFKWYQCLFIKAGAATLFYFCD